MKVSRGSILCWPVFLKLKLLFCIEPFERRKYGPCSVILYVYSIQIAISLFSIYPPYILPISSLYPPLFCCLIPALKQHGESAGTVGKRLHPVVHSDVSVYLYYVQHIYIVTFTSVCDSSNKYFLSAIGPPHKYWSCQHILIRGSCGRGMSTNQQDHLLFS